MKYGADILTIMHVVTNQSIYLTPKLQKTFLPFTNAWFRVDCKIWEEFQMLFIKLTKNLVPKKVYNKYNQHFDV